MNENREPYELRKNRPTTKRFAVVHNVRPKKPKPSPVVITEEQLSTVVITEEEDDVEMNETIPGIVVPPTFVGHQCVLARLL